ncbi:telomerase reverse transcriptase [Colletotrichum plurivorum]|uniref:Telomerase reverse transcriptase n=1 Tax=Colletotrichum plurivorum TaxID=2175906 RepID=A0A8H6NPB5_9PEZI|nr:telomerase reverse transcriptase [Colletotrichum plurivorum]
MAPKRKAQTGREAHQGTSFLKKVKRDHTKTTVKESLLQQYYDTVQTLREYLLSRLPASSRLRRKKIVSLSLPGLAETHEKRAGELELVRLLDTSLVCSFRQARAEPDSRRESWKSFSQKGDESVVSSSGGLAGATCSQAEIVDFVIWQLHSRAHSGAWPKHMLCDGFRKRAQNTGNMRLNNDGPLSGLISVHPNHFAQSLKEAPWPQVLMLLGKPGEQIMIDLLIDTAIFLPVEAGVGNMYQLSGTPMFEQNTFANANPNNPKQADDLHAENAKSPVMTTERLPSEITFMRNRMLYSRAALTARGTVHYGLRHIQEAATEEKERVFQANEQNTLKILMYIFPRQFDLHNVFTSKVDHRKTAQRLPDYTLRKEELSLAFKTKTMRTPKRLRGDVKRLIRQLQRLHSSCAYAELLRHYCPSAIDGKSRKPMQPKTNGQSQKSACSQAQVPGSRQSATSGRLRGAVKSRHKPRHQALSTPTIEFNSITDLATPTAHVSAFCRAVLANIIPNEFWGNGESQTFNRDIILKRVDHFIKLRRFESMSLQEVAEGLKVAHMDWLAPPNLKGLKTSQSDMKKRLEILNEFLYYVFDSILIPLLRSNFYVTESSSDRYRLFFFRHDVWRYIAEPAMADLRTSMFEEVGQVEANLILDSRPLGFSRIRLLPKGKAMRPITNLRRRMEHRGKRGFLAPSINSVLGPVFSMLKLETERNASRLGSSMLSVGDIYERLVRFGGSCDREPTTFYFAKVDVKSAFDTIPQEAIIRLMGRIPSREKYVIKKHLEVKAGLLEARHQKRPKSMLTKRWHAIASCQDDQPKFVQLVEQSFALKKKNAVFVGKTSGREHEARDLLRLMADHIEQNLVKIGKKLYRQKKGIPQGSVLSSTLCNYFYADLEEKHLGFLAEENCLLMRLIDDFLLITTSRSKACKFVEVMHNGLPEYGVTVNPDKTLVNFDMEHDGMKIAKVSHGSPFPYCGLGIDCATLNVVKDCQNSKNTVVSNTLTVYYGHKPGQNFQRRVLNAFKIQSHLMFYDTKHNSIQTVASNVYKAFLETAEKMCAYWRCLPAGKRPEHRLVAQTIAKVVDVAYVLLTGKARKRNYPGYNCALEKAQVTWLALDAMRRVLSRRQANFAPVLAWIGDELGGLDSAKTARVSKFVK